LPMESPCCNACSVSRVHRCGRNSDTFCNMFGMISTGQKPPDSMIVGKIIKLARAPVIFLLLEYATITNDSPMAIKENNHRITNACQNPIPKSILNTNINAHNVIIICRLITNMLKTIFEAVYALAVIGVDNKRKYVRFSFSAWMISDKLTAEN